MSKFAVAGSARNFRERSKGATKFDTDRSHRELSCKQTTLAFSIKRWAIFSSKLRLASTPALTKKMFLYFLKPCSTYNVRFLKLTPEFKREHIIYICLKSANDLNNLI